MTDMSELNHALKTCKFVASWFVWVELADRDDERVRQAVTEAVGLEYGPYEGVAFESSAGMQFFRPQKGSKLGDTAETVEMPARVLTFTVTGDTAILAKAIEAVRQTHSYEEPVIIIQQVWTSRADFSEDRENPNRWWNRGFDV